MNTQPSVPRLDGLPASLRTLRPGRVLPLGSLGGKLEVLHGRVWLTRAGDPDDHFVDFGQSVVVPPSGRTLVEALDDERPALIAWRPGSLVDRVAAMLQSTFGRCWEIVTPARRFGAGAAAALLALAAGALVFGPLSDARTRTLVAPAVLHNSGGAATRLGADAESTTGAIRADAGAQSSERARGTAAQARCRAPGVA